ncbi:MAG TPA: c-type cytochrome [Gemmatimonadota bacterium]|nr:c-type cytochrome [Gemmatimonadota bacterium]
MSTLARAWTFAAVLALVAGCGGDAADEPAEDGDATTETTEAGDGGEMGAPTDAPSDAVASGRAVFVTNCATCHGEDGRGNGPAAVGLEPPPADLTDGTWTTGDGSLAAIHNVIQNGSPGTAMISWQGTLTESQIAALAEFVHSMGGGR